jgi:hypothetical protein
MRKASSRSSSQLLGEKESSGRRKIELIQEAHAFGSEQIAALGQLEPVLGAKEPMNAIAHHRAMPHKETTLAQHLFNLSGGLPADVHPRNETAAQQIGQNVGIDLVGLDLRLGNDSRFERVSQHDVLPRHGLFQDFELVFPRKSRRGERRGIVG